MGVKEMGTIIREARGEMTQEELAFRAHVSQGWISKIELGQMPNPDAEKVRRISAVLGLDDRVLFAAQFNIPYEPGVSQEDLSDDPIILTERIAALSDRLHRVVAAGRDRERQSRIGERA
jgi:transcriptional regulator with XRE-family HTH domain